MKLTIKEWKFLYKLQHKKNPTADELIEFIEKRENEKVSSNENEKRYTVIIGLFVYAENDEKAIKEAEFYIEHNQLVDDNRAEILEIAELPFGSLKKRIIKG